MGIICQKRLLTQPLPEGVKAQRALQGEGVSISTPSSSALHSWLEGLEEDGTGAAASCESLREGSGEIAL